MTFAVGSLYVPCQNLFLLTFSFRYLPSFLCAVPIIFVSEMRETEKESGFVAQLSIFYSISLCSKLIKSPV